MANLEELASNNGLVLLYHAVFEAIPDGLDGTLHNIPPKVMQRQLEHIGRCFEFTTLDALGAMKNPAGYASVSFDDGYQCVLVEGLPVFERLSIPFTVYVNGGTIDGQPSWRDKVRLLENRGWIEEFEKQMQGIDPVPGKRFYRYSKMPVNNSESVDRELDRFLESRGGREFLLEFLLNAPDQLVSHELLTWGNHSQNHYVMSSLNDEQIRSQIQATRDLLNLKKCRSSEWFSVPFGDVNDFNERVAGIATEMGYCGCLLSRYRLQGQPFHCYGHPALERYMPRSEQPDAGLGSY